MIPKTVSQHLSKESITLLKSQTSNLFRLHKHTFKQDMMDNLMKEVVFPVSASHNLVSFVVFANDVTQAFFKAYNKDNGSFRDIFSEEFNVDDPLEVTFKGYSIKVYLVTLDTLEFITYAMKSNYPHYYSKVCASYKPLPNQTLIDSTMALIIKDGFMYYPSYKQIYPFSINHESDYPQNGETLTYNSDKTLFVNLPFKLDIALSDILKDCSADNKRVFEHDALYQDIKDFEQEIEIFYQKASLDEDEKESLSYLLGQFNNLDWLNFNQNLPPSLSETVTDETGEDEESKLGAIIESMWGNVLTDATTTNIARGHYDGINYHGFNDIALRSTDGKTVVGLTKVDVHGREIQSINVTQTINKETKCLLVDSSILNNLFFITLLIQSINKGLSFNEMFPSPEY